MDRVVLTISGVKHWLWRAVDQTRMVLDILVQSRRDMQAAKRFLRNLLKRQCQAPRVMAADKLAWFRKCHFQLKPEIDSALTTREFFALGITLI